MALLVERVEECNGLDGFTKTHLVSKDGVYALTPRVTQPVQTLQLIRMQQHAGRLYKVRLFVILLLQIWYRLLWRRSVPSSAYIIIIVYCCVQLLHYVAKDKFRTVKIKLKNIVIIIYKTIFKLVKGRYINNS